MIQPKFHVRYCTSQGHTRLSNTYLSAGEALEAACWLWLEHRYWGICVVSIVSDNIQVLINEDAVKQTAIEELLASQLN